MADDQTNLKKVASKADPVNPVGTPSSKDNKREATSPLYSEILQQKKTRHESEISGTTELPELPDLPQSPSSVHMLSQPINPVDIVQIASELRSMMLPELKALLADQIPEIKLMVVSAVKEATDVLKEQVKDLQDENKRLLKANSDLEKRLSQVENDNDSLEQYSRRNSIRVSGCPEVADENTDEIVIKLSQELDASISPSDIDRSHRVGKVVDRGRASSGNQRHRDILVKFATYNARQRSFLKRRELREKDSTKHIFLNEDLTQIRSRLLYEARCLVRLNKLRAAYAYDGRLFVRDSDDRRHLIRTVADLSAFGDPREARLELASRAGLPAARRSASSVVPDGAQPMVS